MTPLNYNHLYYFFIVATEGSIAKASVRLHLTPQTISGQISNLESQVGINLFDRKGKRLQLSEMGQMIFEYAEEIFQLGDEIGIILKANKSAKWQRFAVGITEVVPKVLAYQLISPVLKMDMPIRLNCIEGDLDTLLAKMAVHKLDLIITDRPLPSGSQVKAYNHLLAESGLTFFATKKLASQCIEGFPQSLSNVPFLMQGKDAAVSRRLTSWLEKQNIHQNIIAKFDDSALMKSFGHAGYGVFTGPTLIEKEIVSQYRVQVIGRTDEIKEQYFAISPERTLKHPAIVEIVKSVNG